MSIRDPSGLESSGNGSGSIDLQTALRAAGAGFPFRSELSLAPLIAFWTREPAGGGSPKAEMARIISEAVRGAPDLLRPIGGPEVLARHGELVDFLLAAAFPPALREREYGAAMAPFSLRAFFSTPPLRRLLLNKDGLLHGRVPVDERTLLIVRLAIAYSIVLRRVYGINLEIDYPFIQITVDPETGLDRYFRVLFDWQFIEVDTVGEPPALSAEVRARLGANILDGALLREVLPPDRFFFRGFTVLRAVEVTSEEVLSALKHDLIHRESIVTEARFRGLETRLRTFFGRPGLRLGLAALDGDRILLLNCNSLHQHGCIFADSSHHRSSEFAGSLYDRAVKTGQPVIVEDLTAFEGRTHLEDEIIKTGARNFLWAPLHYQDKVIGTLALGSPRPGDLDASHLPKLAEVLPLFSMAVQRSLEELNSRVQTRIKEKFTAIHPVVEWKFRQAVLESLEREGCEAADGAELSPIVFEDVYPLYAISDIRDSSTHRALAIRADLLAQLDLARDVVEAASRERPQPALDDLRYRIGRHRRRIDTGLSSGDEVAVLAFLRQDIEKLFEHLVGFGADTRARVEAYRAALDPRAGAVYAQRRVFEESVTRLAEEISSCIDLEEEVAQTMFPHYFEKRKTDGVDHQIYVGPSLLADGRFDPLFLRNLRLWQLLLVCRIAARADRIGALLPLPLETTHLILAQHSPLCIRFRFDEKRFDVEGAYDLRYEIVKKRIDKAFLRGSSERLTQPGRIAIVYAQPAEASEYRGYVEYLQHLGQLGPEVEDLELEELQGVHGLRALRVAVTLRDADAAPGRAPAAARVAAASGV